MTPIWQDYPIIISNGNYADYRIVVDGDEIFAGRAYPRGVTSGNIVVTINGIAADYLAQAMPAFPTTTGTPCDICKTFEVWVDADDPDDPVAVVTFLYDWSYDRARASAVGTPTLHAPITYDIDDACFVPISLAAEGDKYVVHTGATPYTFDDSDNTNYVLFAEEHDTDGVLQYSYYSNGSIVESVAYAIRPRCARFALYYVNAFGGWDVFLPAPRYERTDAISRITTGVDVANTEKGYQRRTLAAEYEEAYTLHTPWLTDAQSDRMHHLLTSPFVLLHDRDTGRFLPVLIDNAECVHRRYRNERTPISYDIALHVAQKRERR